MFGGTGLFCIYRVQRRGQYYAWDGIMGNIQPKVNDDGKMDYLLNVIVGGTGPLRTRAGFSWESHPGVDPSSPQAHFA